VLTDSLNFCSEAFGGWEKAGSVSVEFALDMYMGWVGD
jgi:hypothetical protein